MSNSSFTSTILEWYQLNKRELPWRENINPYSVWLSEIILQQTRVAQGTPYYLKFLETFATVADLAAASEESVLRIWQGLGYYSRARNLHKCAKVVVEKYGGEFPSSYEALLELPGIGPYTAAAIASICFNEAVPVVDGNVYRVLARVFNIQEDIAGGASFKVFYNQAASLMDTKQPGEFNQALMELGATVCSPKSPGCDNCPIQHSCEGFRLNLQESLPIKTKKIKKRNRYFHYLDIRIGDLITLRQRGAKDIWQGLYDFYLIEKNQTLPFEELEDELLLSLAQTGVEIVNEIEFRKHVLSHQNLFTTVFQLRLSDNAVNRKILKGKGLTLYSLEETNALAKPILIANYLNRNSISIDL